MNTLRFIMITKSNAFYMPYSPLHDYNSCKYHLYDIELIMFATFQL